AGLLSLNIDLCATVSGPTNGRLTAPRAGMVLVFPFMEGFCFDAGSLRGAAGPTNGRLVSVALFTLIVNPQHDRSPLQAHLVCETASPSRLILNEIRLTVDQDSGSGYHEQRPYRHGLWVFRTVR